MRSVCHISPFYGQMIANNLQFTPQHKIDFLILGVLNEPKSQIDRQKAQLFSWWHF